MNIQSRLILGMLTSAGVLGAASAQMVIGQKATTVAPKTLVMEKPMTTAVLPVLAPAKPVMMATPISPAVGVQGLAPKALNLGDMNKGIAGGNSSGSGAASRTIPGSGGMYRASTEDNKDKERTREAPPGSLASGGKEAQRTALENERGREISASELIKTHQQRTLDGLKAAAAPLGGMDGKEVTDRSGARTNALPGQGGNPLDSARAITSVDADAGKNATSKRAQQSEANGTTEKLPSFGQMVWATKPNEHSAVLSIGEDILQQVLSNPNLAAEKPHFVVLTAVWNEMTRLAPPSDSGTKMPTPDQAGGDGGPVPLALSFVDRQPRSFSESRAALKRQVTLPGEGTGSTEKTYVNPGEAAKAVMGARQQNLINPSREESTVTSSPIARNSAGQSGTQGNPVPSGGGGTNPDGGSGDPFCPTCRN